MSESLSLAVNKEENDSITVDDKNQNVIDTTSSHVESSGELPMNISEACAPESVKEELFSGTNDNSNESHITDDASSISTFISICDDSNSLFGMWEGSFNVWAVTGDQLVNEKFFIYKCSGAQIDAEDPFNKVAASLPPEPVVIDKQYRYIYVRVIFLCVFVVVCFISQIQWISCES